MKAVFLGEANEDIEENILNEVESLDSIYHVVFEEFKDVLRVDGFGIVKILLSALGYPVLEEVHEVSTEQGLVCKGKNAHATGEYKDGGVVVYKGSICNIEEARTAGSWVINMRTNLLNSSILEQQENVYVFTSDYAFPSPSAAAAAVLGRRANGWTEWKDEAGKTLDELKRKPD
ncbi:DUF4357 domain-containing protein [Bacillus cereus group sp. BfR-BA-01380]|uniref:DUF4357 domain-containing protein n=1 Tax=Bacillus cereus group sp. BfR-BA-01380 TaxID=2920324 RepID=UPI001F56342B|nr:DUF4357 domain-containing protein [Bacillus cereus group sp. BfR-BA-01380]